MLSSTGYFTKPVFTEVLMDRKHHSLANTESINKHRAPRGKDVWPHLQPSQHQKSSRRQVCFSAHGKAALGALPLHPAGTSPRTHGQLGGVGQHRGSVGAALAPAVRCWLLFGKDCAPLREPPALHTFLLFAKTKMQKER